MALYFSSDSRQGNYKLQQTEKERGGKSYSLSQKTVVVKLSPNSKLAYVKAQKKGVEEGKLKLSYQYMLALTKNAVKRFRRWHLYIEKIKWLG